jgi:predicted amidohydrolase
MKITLAQLQLTASVSKNTAAIIEAVKEAPAGTVVFPEGMLSGYEVNDKNWLKNLSFTELEETVKKIGNSVKEKHTDVIFGSAWMIKGSWFNCGLYINSIGKLQYIYPKINLAAMDKPHFQAGDSLPAFKFKGLTAGIQICREVRYPEQWRFLAVNGVKIFFHLNNAQKPTDAIWEHLLISRAYENQSFVISVNAVSPTQSLPSFVIDPDGKVLAKTSPKSNELITVDLNLKNLNSDFLSQRRADVVDIAIKSS